MWRGSLAFARHADGGFVPRIMYLAAGKTTARTSAEARSSGARNAGTAASACSTTASTSSTSGRRAPRTLAHDGRSGVRHRHRLGAARRPARWRPSTLLDSGLISGACGFGLPELPEREQQPDRLPRRGRRLRRDGDQLRDDRPGDRCARRRGDARRPRGRRHPRRQHDLLAARRQRHRGRQRADPGAASCTVANAGCELVASPAPAYAAQPSRRQSSPADVDIARSDLGYSWVRGPGGTQLLRPPARVPCALSLQAAYVYSAARWTSGRHVVRVLRRDPRGSVISVGAPQTRGLPGFAHQSRLVRCGDRTRFTYVVTTGRTTQRVSFAVARAAAPAAPRG